MNTGIPLKLGRSDINIVISHPQLMDSFRGFLSPIQGKHEPLKIGTYEKSQYLSQFPSSRWDAYAEYKCLLVLASDAMMKEDQFIYHSAAVLVNDKIWLISGPSGIGKSTQYKNLKELYGKKIEIISGDNPVLSFEEKGITVYPSPWNGKEGWGSMKTGKLKGIILLSQANKNTLTPLTPEEAVLPVYKEINTYAKTEEQIRLLARLEERLLNTVPVYSYENTGDRDSSKLLYEQLLNKEEAA